MPRDRQSSSSWNGTGSKLLAKRYIFDIKAIPNYGRIASYVPLMVSMQAPVDISMNDTDTLCEHYQPTNQVPEEVLRLITAWEEAFSQSTDFSLNQDPRDLDLYYKPTEPSESPQRYRRKSIRPNKNNEN